MGAHGVRRVDGELGRDVLAGACNVRSHILQRGAKPLYLGTNNLDVVVQRMHLCARDERTVPLERETLQLFSQRASQRRVALVKKIKRLRRHEAAALVGFRPFAKLIFAMIGSSSDRCKECKIRKILPA